MTGTEHVEGMDRARRARRKLAEWIRRYLPCEITGTVGELGGAAVTYALTDSLAAAAIVATIGAMVGYYAMAYINAVRWSVRSQRHRPWPLRFVVANLLAIRSVVVEFGPAEVIDSGLIRPLAYYMVPLLVGNATVGFLIAKVAADVTFYSCAIFSYERFGALVARRRQNERAPAMKASRPLRAPDTPSAHAAAKVGTSSSTPAYCSTHACPYTDRERTTKSLLFSHRRVQEEDRMMNTPAEVGRYHESRASTYSKRLPITPVEGRGSHIRDVQGRWYLDCLAGAGAVSLGWNHPVVTEAIRKTLDSGEPLLTLDFHTPVRDAFVADLLATLPAGLANDCVVHLCSPSGANAIEAALMLAEIATGGREHVAVQGGFHGCSRAARSVSSGGDLRMQPVALSPGVHFLPYPQDYRCPFGMGGDRGVELAINAIDNMFTNPQSGLSSPASVLTEFVLGEGGVIPAVPAWAQALRHAASQADIPLIADEVQAGVYRTGRAWAFDRCNVEPDVIAISKGLGSGVPIAVLVIRRCFDVWDQGAFTGTFRGNAMAFAVASAVLRFAARSNLSDHVTAMGLVLAEGLSAIAADADIIGDVRAIGLMAGAEMVDPTVAAGPRNVQQPSATLAEMVQAECLASGLIVELGGRYGNVVRFLPPLTIDDAEIATVLEIFSGAVNTVQRSLYTERLTPTRSAG